MGTYPERPQFFANHFIRTMVKTCLAQDVSPTGFALLTTIVMTEDASHYRRPVTFYDAQLMPLIGVNSKKTMTNVRRRCVAAGWLHYEPGHKGVASRYFVIIPKHAEGLDDLPTDEGFGSFFEPNGDRKGTGWGPQGGRYIPIPIPTPSSGADEASLLNGKPERKTSRNGVHKAKREKPDPFAAIRDRLTKKFAPPIVDDALTVARRFTELNPDRRTVDTAEKIAGRFAGFISEHRKTGAVELLTTYYALDDAKQWQAEVDAGKRLALDAPPLKVCRFLESRRKANPVQTNPKGPDPRVEAERRKVEAADKHAAKPGDCKRWIQGKDVAHA